MEAEKWHLTEDELRELRIRRLAKLMVRDIDTLKGWIATTAAKRDVTEKEWARLDTQLSQGRERQ